MLFISDPRKKPMRSFILVMAIASSMSLFIVLSSLSIGIRESSRDALEGVGADIYVVPEALNPLLKDLQSFDQGWAVEREISIHEPKPIMMSSRLKETIFFIDGDGELDETVVDGVVPSNEIHFGQYRVVKGTWFDIEGDPIRDIFQRTGEINDTSFTGELLLSEALMQRTGFSIGDEIELSARYSSADSYSFVIKGVYLDTLSRRSQSMLIHLGDLQYMKGLLKKDTLTEILLDYGDDADLDGIIDWSEKDSFLYRENVDLYLKEDFLSEIYKFISILDGFSLIVISVTLVVCLIFTSTIFMISTKQRSLDLAVLRAIGFHPFRVLYFVIREAVLYYFIGAIAGVLLALLFNRILNAGIKGFTDGLPSDFQPFSASSGLLLVTFLMAFVLAILSAMVPALISARRSPIAAIRGDL